MEDAHLLLSPKAVAASPPSPAGGGAAAKGLERRDRERRGRWMDRHVYQGSADNKEKIHGRGSMEKYIMEVIGMHLSPWPPSCAHHLWLQDGRKVTRERREGGKKRRNQRRKRRRGALCWQFKRSKLTTLERKGGSMDPGYTR
uniref:Uncharacterized protein n=1 Tax=Oryza rufipogon TaxID=4529 RepID=A0A0E0R652_ORYRU